MTKRKTKGEVSIHARHSVRGSSNIPKGFEKINESNVKNKINSKKISLFYTSSLIKPEAVSFSISGEVRKGMSCASIHIHHYALEVSEHLKMETSLFPPSSGS